MTYLDNSFLKTTMLIWQRFTKYDSYRSNNILWLNFLVDYQLIYQQDYNQGNTTYLDKSILKVTMLIEAKIYQIGFLRNQQYVSTQLSCWLATDVSIQL